MCRRCKEEHKYWRRTGYFCCSAISVSKKKTTSEILDWCAKFVPQWGQTGSQRGSGRGEIVSNSLCHEKRIRSLTMLSYCEKDQRTRSEKIAHIRVSLEHRCNETGETDKYKAFLVVYRERKDAMILNIMLTLWVILSSRFSFALLLRIDGAPGILTYRMSSQTKSCNLSYVPCSMSNSYCPKNTHICPGNEKAYTF